MRFFQLFWTITNGLQSVFLFFCFFFFFISENNFSSSITVALFFHVYVYNAWLWWHCFIQLGFTVDFFSLAIFYCIRNRFQVNSTGFRWKLSGSDGNDIMTIINSEVCVIICSCCCIYSIFCCYFFAACSVSWGLVNTKMCEYNIIIIIIIIEKKKGLCLTRGISLLVF